MKIARIAIATSFALLVGASGSAPVAVAAEADPGRGCAEHREIGERLYVQDFESTDVTGGVAGLPDRVTTDLGPGERGTVCVGFHNRTGADVTLAFRAHDVGASRSGAPIPVAAGDEVYGAGRWIDLPPTPRATIEHGELVWLAIEVAIPDDTAGGSAYAGVSATIVEESSDSDAQEPQAQIAPAVVVQIFFDVPGDSTRGGSIEDVASPGIVWWDGLDIGDVPFLEGLRGPGIAPIRFTWRNSGAFSEQISGDVSFEASLGGRDVAKVAFPEQIVLRDAKRRFETTWSRDIPFVGRFTPTIEVRDSAGTVHRRTLDPIWVIPSWWYLLALVLAVALPLWWRRRSRRRMDELLARVEAAEARAAGGDETWDQDTDWDDPR